MKEEKKSAQEVLRVVKQKASKLPLGFILGAVVGGGIYLYASRNVGAKSVKAITGVAKLAAPYVIITLLDKFVDSYENKQIDPPTSTTADIEVEDVLQVEVM